MSLGDIVLLIVVAGACGAAAQMLTGYSNLSCLVSIFLGFVGAALGFFLCWYFNLPKKFTISIGPIGFPVLWSVGGAVAFIVVTNVLTGGKRRRR